MTRLLHPFRFCLLGSMVSLRFSSNLASVGHFQYLYIYYFNSIRNKICVNKVSLFLVHVTELKNRLQHCKKHWSILASYRKQDALGDHLLMGTISRTSLITSRIDRKIKRLWRINKYLKRFVRSITWINLIQTVCLSTKYRNHFRKAFWSTDILSYCLSYIEKIEIFLHCF